MIRSARLAFTSIALAVAVSLAALAPARAQSQNQNLATPLITSSARVASATEVTSVTQTNIDKRGIVCTYAATASSGSTDTTWGIQQYDTATNTYITVKQNASALKGGSAYATDAPNVPHTIAVYPGVAVSSLATNMEAQSAVLPRAWRVFQTTTAAAGSTTASPTITAKIGCNYIK